MGIQRSFRIEVKRFDISLEDGSPVQVKIKESGKRHLCSVHLSKDGAWWLAKGVEENITREGDPSFLRTYRENDQGFVFCRQGNDHGRFVKLMVYGKGGVQGRLVIPEGKQQGGWQGFLAELRHVLEPKKQPLTDHGILPAPEPRTAAVVGINHRNGGHRTWSSTLFPHKENIAQSKRKGGDQRDYCGDNAGESFGGFGAKLQETVNPINEVVMNLKVKLTCNLAGEWKATWVGLDETGSSTNANEPTPAGPPPIIKQVWKPVGPRPTRPTPQQPILHTSGPQGKPVQPVKPTTHKPQNINPVLELSNSNRFSVFEVGDSSGTTESQPIHAPSPPGPLPGSLASGLPEAPTMATATPPSTVSPSPLPSLSDAASQHGVAGLETTMDGSFSVTLGPQESRPGDCVAHAWGTPQDWFLELKDGQRLRLPVEIEKSILNSSSHDHLLNWCDAIETTSGGDPEEYGTVTILGSETQDRMELGDMEVSGDTFVEHMEPISVSPLAMAPPPLDGGESVTFGPCGEFDECSELSEWVNGRYKAFGKLVGAYCEGYEREVIALLVSIKARRNQRKPVSVGHRTPKKQGNKGSRELKGLVSSVNYDSRAMKARHGSRDGDTLLIQ
jgi:hypothetical protein